VVQEEFKGETAPGQPSGEETSGFATSDSMPTSDSLLREFARIPAAAPRLLPELVKGTRLGRYIVVSTLGKGGMGVVYAAEDTKLARIIALKVLAADGEDRRGRFLREATSAAAIKHQNIATIYDYGEEDGRVFIAMELLRGESLDKRLRGPALTIAESVRIACEVARGLAIAHAKGIVHRDIKPANVMITDEKHVKLLDFGLAKFAERREDTPDAVPLDHFTTVEQSVIGTPGYMSPEQYKGERVDVRSDVFSFGVMLYEMVTGRRPFEGRSATEVNIAIVRDEPPPPSSVNANAPPEIDHIVMRCLQKVASARYADAGELLGELERPMSAAPRRKTPATNLGKRSLWAVVIAGSAVAGLSLAWWANGAGAPVESTLQARIAEPAHSSITPISFAPPAPPPTPAPTDSIREGFLATNATSAAAPAHAVGLPAASKVSVRAKPKPVASAPKLPTMD
jgi:serine/threonine-protein kinase